MRTYLRGNVRLLFMMLGLLIAIPAVALADELANNLDVSIDNGRESLALESHGRSGTAEIYVNPTAGGSDPAGCNFNAAGETLKVRVLLGNNNATAVWDEPNATNNGLDIEFTGCDNPATNDNDPTTTADLENSKTIKVTSGNITSATASTPIDFQIVTNTAGGTFDPQTARFVVNITRDTTAPTVQGTPTGADQPVDTNVTASFNEAMNASTISGSTFTLKKTSDNSAVGASVTYSTADNKATLDPTNDLAPGTQYTATVVGGTNGVKDLAGNALATTQTWSFTTLNPNTAPVAVNDNYSVNEGATLNVSAPGVLGNDIDAQSNPLTAALVSGPANASSFSLNGDGSFIYVHNGSETTSDSFTYKANDGQADSNVATVNIIVVPVNDPPTCQNVAIETDEDTEGSVEANCSDPDGDQLTYAIEDQPADGDASVDGSTLKYNPDLNFNGSDSFTYSASDGTASSDPADVDVTVNPVNDPPPTPGAISTTSALSSDGTFTLNWGASIDVDGDNVTYTLEKRDANDANWSQVASGLSLSSYTFGGSNPAEDEGTWDYRVKAVDSPAGAESDFSTAENLVKVDKSAPSQPNATTNPANPVANSGGWFMDSVTVSYNGSTDPALLDTSGGSGVASYTADQVFSTSGTHDYSGKATDHAGNESAATTGQVKVDADNPTFGNCQGGPFLVNSGSGTPTTQSVTITASDNESGIDTVNSQLTKSVNTTSTGTKTVTFTAKDKVGHSVTKNCDYTVGAYDFVGFSSPVDNQPTMNSAKAGQAIPLKWRLMNNGTPVTNLQSVTVTASSLTCSLGTSTDLMEEYASGSSGLQNLGDGYYQFNWKTPTSYAKSCKSVQINGVGMQLTAPQQPWFQFTK